VSRVYPWLGSDTSVPADIMTSPKISLEYTMKRQ
jgi:hypothetical protein